MSDHTLDKYLQTISLNREIGAIRPPSEFDSLLLRIVRNCTWNKCVFCSFYNNQRFSKRCLNHILNEIDEISREITYIIKWDRQYMENDLNYK